jgi:hypothetical protein
VLKLGAARARAHGFEIEQAAALPDSTIPEAFAAIRALDPLSRAQRTQMDSQVGTTGRQRQRQRATDCRETRIATNAPPGPVAGNSVAGDGGR